MWKAPALGAGVLALTTVMLYYFMFAGIDGRQEAALCSFCLILVNLAVMVSGWYLAYTRDDDVSGTAGFSFLVFGGLLVFCILASTAVGLAVSQYIPCLSYMVSIQAAFTLGLLVLRAYFALGTVLQSSVRGRW